MMNEQFEKAVIELLGPSALAGGKLSFYEVAEMFWTAALESQKQERSPLKPAGPEDQAVYKAIADNFSQEKQEQKAEPVAEVAVEGWPSIVWNWLPDAGDKLYTTPQPSPTAKALVAAALLEAAKLCEARTNDLLKVKRFAGASGAYYLSYDILALIHSDHMQALRELMMEAAHAGWKDGYACGTEAGENGFGGEGLSEIVDRILTERGVTK
jgi:hypothetical protein